MPDEPNKPRKIKDLKARLGRTITPGTAGAAPGAAVPPPNLGGPVARPRGIVAPPSMRGPGSNAPSSPGGIVAPPFAQPAAPSQPADPFGAPAPAAPTAAQQVHLVIDETVSVSDEEAGRKKRGRVPIILGMGAILGLIVGFGVGSTANSRTTYKLAAEDGQAIYHSVHEASDKVNQAKTLLDRAVAAMAAGPGKTPHVDYEAITALRAIEKPFTAGMFNRRRYSAFNPTTVDQLFDYYNNVGLLWDGFEQLAARVGGEARHQELDRSAAALGSMSTAPTGCIPQSNEGMFSCALVFVQPPELQEGQPPPTTAQVRSSRMSRHMIEKTIYTGQDLSDNPSQYVILNDGVHSQAVLGEPATAFLQLNQELMRLKVMMDQTSETQGQLEQGLGDIARLAQ